MPNSNHDPLQTVFKVTDGLQYEVDSDNMVTILKKQNHPIQQVFRKLSFKIPEYTKESFDAYGSYVFLQIDGQATVQEIGAKLEAQYSDKVHPLYERLLLFLNHIHRNCRYIEKLN